MSLKRKSLNGCWILDKTKEPWSMSKYLETMQVDPLAVQAHEKGEKDFDTFHTIEMNRRRVKITKRSRVNSDLVTELELGREFVEYLSPGYRPKRSIARSEGPDHLCIESSLLTFNGQASITDVKRIVEMDGKSILVQELTIHNEKTGQSHTTVRHFNPYMETPPHLADATNTT